MLIRLLAGLILAIPLLAQQYAGNTSTAYIPAPPTPPPPAKGSFYYDTSFVPTGVAMLRVTDINTVPHVAPPCDIPLNRGFQMQDDAENKSWDADNDMFIFQTGFGIPMSVDYANRAVSFLPPHNLSDIHCGFMLISGNTPNYSIRRPWQFSGVTHGLIYGQRQDSSNSVVSLNLTNPGTTSTVVASFNALPVSCNSHVGELTTTPDDKIFMAICGGNQQDNDPYVVYYNANTSQYHYLNGISNTIDGSPYAPGSDLINCFFHNAKVDRSGQYALITITNACGGGNFVWTFATGTVKSLTYVNKRGHKVATYGSLYFAGGCPNPLGRTIGGLIPYTSPSSCTPVGAPYTSATDNSTDSHISWPGPTVGTPFTPTFISTYNSTNAPVPLAPYTREIFVQYTSGSQYGLVTRIARTWANNEYQAFTLQSLMQCSPNGLMCAFGTNWGGQLGSAQRTDIFLVFMPGL
jgi:hypothetical protein